LVRKAGGDDFDGRSNAAGAVLATQKKTWPLIEVKVLSLSNISLPFLQRKKRFGALI
jgi:hypothetical protein